MKTIPPLYWREATRLFSCAVVCVYSWSMLALFWNMPSYLLRFSPVEIVTLAAYQFMFALYESLIMTAVAAALVFILPIKGIKENFSITGSLLLLALAVGALMFREIPRILTWVARFFPAGGAGMAAFALPLLTMVALMAVSIALVKYPPAKKMLSNFIDNLAILSGLYALLGLLGGALVLYRNL